MNLPPLVVPAENPLSALSWIDLTALAILLTFCVLGLFRGLVWQISRIVTILLGIHLSGLFAGDVAPRIAPWFGRDVDPMIPHYAAYFAIFLAVLIVLSLVAWLVEKLVRKTGLTFYDRVGGGVLGLATGAAAVLVLLILVFTLFPTEGSVARAAHGSKALEWSKKALAATRGIVPEKWIPQGVRKDFGLEEPQQPATQRK